MAKRSYAALVLSLVSVVALAQNTWQSQPTEASKKLPIGSSAERKARMSARANRPAYTKQFDLSGLPHYVPEQKLKGKLRICGNNYVGDAPLGGYWKQAFEKFQPGIKIEYFLPTAAIAVPCLYFDRADIGVNHAPSFYDSLAHLRLKGYEPTGISVVTGSFDYVGWQNNMVIVVNKNNPITGVTMKQLDGIFGSARDGGWVGATWHPEFARGPEQDIRSWGQLGLQGSLASEKIHPYGYSLRYATAIEFSNKVLQASDKWNGDLHAFANYRRPDGTTYLEADQITDQVAKDPAGIGYVRYHDGFPKDVKVLAVARDDSGPFVDYNIDTLQNRSYPLWGDQSFWVSIKPGEKMDPKVREFIRFVLSREGQEAVEKDGKYLPLSADSARAELKKLN
ncbi:PstS family phosphate ABC transporter substrate-binding protein [Paraburkholderia youngii]|uniref:PstS family phosphate ABC transporter substrate-binding protein n=1 Tax=Paraburkholderia youngii TaxID=2782701 RepID=UPI003D21EC66